ncbi:DUF3570 domain-containing protein [Aliikangiella coralliicola]|uniref:DUF3570 domain-containing protein n=1 Tax=Aliikangiella coralliicola TaxID=2592383 RepID=A0A545UAU7_9GAMM|nr:DUF3570 domain-containing protein [Aliikangiella coralliicola]TQV86578.1 DUF3570 domain-containing protein [Aliikangiella coralliicola]
MRVIKKINKHCLSYKVVLVSLFFGLNLSCNSLLAAVLPVDRADALYHYFEGGGVDIQGPSFLVRKSIKDTVSISANYYVDNVSSASIDVVTTASAYTEERKEKSVGIDYLRDKTVMSFNYTESDENDFSARSAHFNVSQDFFGDLTTLNIGYSQGWDTVGKRDEPEFSRDTDRRHFRLGVSQILTKNSLINVSWETITDEGLLNNPYRSVRYLDPSVATGYSFQDELYPDTRTSDSFAIRGLYYLPYRAALKLELKQFSDTWGIGANTAEVGYTHPIGDEWTLEFKLRSYKQDQADFYSDLFPRIDAQNFRARDKEMSAFTTNSIGVGVTYEQPLKSWENFDKFSFNLYVDHIQFDYDNFRDIRVSAEPGTEPFYSFNANVVRLFLSLYY